MCDWWSQVPPEVVPELKPWWLPVLRSMTAKQHGSTSSHLLFGREGPSRVLTVLVQGLGLTGTRGCFSVCKAGACTCLCLASGLGPRLSLRLFPLMAAPQAPRAVGCDSGMPPRPTACRQASKSGVPCHAGPCEGGQSPWAREGQGPQGDPDLDHGDRSQSGMGYCTLCACVDEQKRKL